MRDIPQPILDAVLQALIPYYVGLLGVENMEGEDTIEYVGSGVLAQVADRRCILTAAHVWEDVSRYPEVGLCLYETMHDTRVLPRDFRAHVLYDREDIRWGPDLALLELPPPVRLEVKPEKKFVNLVHATARVSQAGPDIKAGICAILGAPASASQIFRQSAALHGGPWFGSVEAVYEKDGFDYVDIGVDKRDTQGVPGSFAGLSGGSAWHFVLHKSAQGDVFWKGELDFLGVVISQTSVVAGRCVLRCHGPRGVHAQVGRLLADASKLL